MDELQADVLARQEAVLARGVVEECAHEELPREADYDHHHYYYLMLSLRRAIMFCHAAPEAFQTLRVERFKAGIKKSGLINQIRPEM